MEKTEQRRLLLEILYNYNQKVPGASLDGKTIAKKSGMSWEDTVAAALYLRDKGYIEMIPFGEFGTKGIIGFQAKINARGIDLVENRSELETEFPVTEVYLNSKVQKIQQVIGVVSQDVDVHVDTVNYALIEEFIGKMHSEAEKHITDPVVLQNTKEQIDEIEQAAKQGSIDKVKNIGAKLAKQAGGWIKPIVTQLVVKLVERMI